MYLSLVHDLLGTLLGLFLDLCLIATKNIEKAVAYDPQIVLDQTFQRLINLFKNIHSVQTDFKVRLQYLLTNGVNEMICWSVLRELVLIGKCEFFYSV